MLTFLVLLDKHLQPLHKRKVSLPNWYLIYLDLTDHLTQLVLLHNNHHLHTQRNYH